MSQSKHFVVAVEDGRIMEVIAPPSCSWKNAMEQVGYNLITEGVENQQVTINHIEENENA